MAKYKYQQRGSAPRLRLGIKSENTVPPPPRKVNKELVAFMDTLQLVSRGQVLVVDVPEGRTPMSVKMMITRAAKALGKTFQYWSVNGTVYAKPLPKMGWPAKAKAKARRS